MSTLIRTIVAAFVLAAVLAGCAGEYREHPMDAMHPSEFSSDD